MRINGLKICGISDPATALFCEKQGAGAVGVVFFPKSSRNVTAELAARILRPLGSAIAKVGVFVNMPIEQLLQTAETAGLTTLQMHGNETHCAIEKAQREGYRVIKVLKSSGRELEYEASALPINTGIMVELSKGTLPGGNGAIWEWSSAAVLAGKHDFALAGGLNAQNLNVAMKASGAVALDLSSAVESSPGKKDHAKIKEVALRAGRLNLTKTFWR